MGGTSRKTLIEPDPGLRRPKATRNIATLQKRGPRTGLNRANRKKQHKATQPLQRDPNSQRTEGSSTDRSRDKFRTDPRTRTGPNCTWPAPQPNTTNKPPPTPQWAHNPPLASYSQDNLPTQLVKTHNLLTTRNYIFGYHPHGIMGLGAFCNFSTEATEVSKKFPGIRPYLATLAGNFRMPLLREYLMSGGICPVNRDTIDYLLSKNGSGNAIIIVVGGTAESLSSRPGKNAVTLRNRKGFVKLALRHGADLVPTYSFGENEVYKQVIFEEGSWGLWVQQKFQKYIGFAPCIFHGRGFFSSNTWGLVPYSKPITTKLSLQDEKTPLKAEQAERKQSYTVELTQGKVMINFGLKMKQT
ncbi:diacylglycerol O-acyltransferase 2-like [Echinops telfairi]|uniref:Acyltransferase n=1 Tax=Echinops telfairi TaxID=9371 RepID=A0ABM0ZQX4_ECHTE|nr:diacylglycerol O-acyltransferase 2-like [Echinops telfairi]